jgi:hypothetical protein
MQNHGQHEQSDRLFALTLPHEISEDALRAFGALAATFSGALTEVTSAERDKHADSVGAVVTTDEATKSEANQEAAAYQENYAKLRELVSGLPDRSHSRLNPQPFTKDEQNQFWDENYSEVIGLRDFGETTRVQVATCIIDSTGAEETVIIVDKFSSDVHRNHESRQTYRIGQWKSTHTWQGYKRQGLFRKSVPDPESTDSNEANSLDLAKLLDMLTSDPQQTSYLEPIKDRLWRRTPEE